MPIYTVREELMATVRENQVVIIVGETGSGKTTQVRITKALTADFVEGVWLYMV